MIYTNSLSDLFSCHIFHLPHTIVESFRQLTMVVFDVNIFSSSCWKDNALCYCYVCFGALKCFMDYKETYFEAWETRASDYKEKCHFGKNKKLFKWIKEN